MGINQNQVVQAFGNGKMNISNIELLEVLETAKEIQDNSKSDRTRIAAKKNYKKCAEFFNRYDFELFDAEKGSYIIKTPLNSEHIIFFISSLVQDGKSIATIKQAVSNICTLHLMQGFPNPQNKKVTEFLKGAKVTINRTEKQAKGMTIQDIERGLQNIEQELLEGSITEMRAKRDKAILLLGFFGCFRRSELCDLHINDSTTAKCFVRDHLKGIEVVMKQFKHSTETKYKSIPANPASKLCPVAAVRNWIMEVKKQVSTPSNVFVSIHRSGKIKGKKLNGQTIGVLVKKYCGPEFSGHSLRVGFAQTARDSGASIEDIKRMGNWVTDAMPSKYARDSDRWINNATSQIFESI